MPTSTYYNTNDCSVDLDATVYDGEINTLKTMLSDASFMEVVNEILKDDPVYNSRKQLLKRALHLSPAIAPHVYDVLAVCIKNLGLTLQPDVYVYQDLAFNASCYPSDRGRIYILLTSSILERFSNKELTFVLGHEIGHYLFNHHRLPIKILLDKADGRLSPIQALRLYSWSRGCEVSADRIGYLCGRDFDAAGHAFFKLSSGITDEKLTFHLGDYVKQFDDLSEELKNTEIDPEDMYSSHPFSPLRLKALEIFSKSRTYTTLIGQTGGDISEADMESTVHSFMSLVEPTCLKEGGDAGPVVNEFVFLSGFWIAAANGRVEENEMKSLASMVDPATFQAGIARVSTLTPPIVQGRLTELAEKLNMSLAVVAKLNILRDLTVIAIADGSVEEAELNVLHHIADLLNIRPEFIDQTLESMVPHRT